MSDIRNQRIMDFSPATRKTHPETSGIAEKNITKTGRRQKHCEIILTALRQHNGSTTKDLAIYLKGILTHAQIWRRRADLINNDYIEVEGVRDGYGICWII